MEEICNKNNFLYVSRAATAIYLILKAHELCGEKVLVPANICYAAVFPIIFSGNEPVFCDINDEYGNVSLSQIAEHQDISAAIIPHMYGNPIEDIERIQKYFNSKGILFIEDCASAMGAKIAGKKCGNWGDYSIFSTGYSKTVDLGKGGIVCSDCDLSKLDEIYRGLHALCPVDLANEEFFSKVYRLIRNSKNQTLDEYIWQAMAKGVKDIFIHRSQPMEDYIRDGILNWEQVVLERRRKQRLFQNLIVEKKYLRIMIPSENASPWRFSIFVEDSYHDEMIKYLLENNVPVSDWYPDVTPIFGYRGYFPNVKKMEREILNFPLLLKEREIYRIAEVINKYQPKTDK